MRNKSNGGHLFVVAGVGGWGRFDGRLLKGCRFGGRLLDGCRGGVGVGGGSGDDSVDRFGRAGATRDGGGGAAAGALRQAPANPGRFVAQQTQPLGLGRRRHVRSAARPPNQSLQSAQLLF